MEGLIIAFVLGFVAHWLIAGSQRRLLKQYREREKWLAVGQVRPVEPRRR
jgi:elongation factor P hydroxylase